MIYDRNKRNANVATTSKDDLTNLDIAAGQCVNKTIQQNITFGTQGLPFGINLGDGKKGAAAAARPMAYAGMTTTASTIVLMMVVAVLAGLSG